MDRILVVLIGIPLGFLIMIYRFQIKQYIGDIGFAEQYLGAGGTYTLLTLIGFLVAFVSLMYGLGTIQELFIGTLGQFFR